MTKPVVIIGVIVTLIIGLLVCCGFFIFSRLYFKRRLKGEGKIRKLPQPLTVIITVIIFITVVSSSFIIWGVVSSKNDNSIFKNEYNAVLSEGYAFENYESGLLTLVKSKEQLDNIYPKTLKEIYANDTGRDFDTDYPYNSIDFEKRMLVICYDYRPCYGEVYVLKKIAIEYNTSVQKNVLNITYTDTKELVGSAFQLRCIVVEIDRLDVESVTMTKL